MYSLPVGKWITIANITICPSTVCTVYTSCIYHTTGARVKYIYICILNEHYFFISPHIIQNFFKHPPLNQRKKLQPQPAVLIRKIKYRRCKAPPIVQRCIYYKELEFEFFDARGRSTRMPCSSLNEKIIQKCRVVLFAQRYWDIQSTTGGSMFTHPRPLAGTSYWVTILKQSFLEKKKQQIVQFIETYT